MRKCSVKCNDKGGDYFNSYSLCKIDAFFAIWSQTHIPMYMHTCIDM